jgi:hypothetical protein
VERGFGCQSKLLLDRRDQVARVATPKSTPVRAYHLCVCHAMRKIHAPTPSPTCAICILYWTIASTEKQPVIDASEFAMADLLRWRGFNNKNDSVLLWQHALTEV